MKTIGTLEEIGAQIGDVVTFGAGFYIHEITHIGDDGDYWSMVNDGKPGKPNMAARDWRIVTRRSPVRTVTRKEIVPGVYGRLNVVDTTGQWIEIEFIGEYGHTGRPRLTASDLAAAIGTLTEIRDAMEGDE